MTELSNLELFLYVLWRLGATGKYVDIEDAVEEAYRLSPSKFGWRTRAVPSDKTGDQALRDISKQFGKGFVMVSKNRDLQLSAKGVIWLEANLSRIEAAVDQGVLSGPERPSQRPLVELESIEWVRAFAASEEVAVNRIQFAEVLHLAPDADALSWRERTETLRSAAQRSGRDRVIAFINRLEDEHPDWFGR